MIIECKIKKKHKMDEKKLSFLKKGYLASVFVD